MKKTKAVSLLLSLSLLATLAIPGTLAQSVQADTTQENKGMVINKTAVANDDGSYTITLEAYGTGDKVTTTVTNEKPTDIVLVLDQSGSMTQNNMSTVTFEPYASITNSSHYSRRHNGGSSNLWHMVGDKYYSVSVTVQEVTKHNEITSGKNNSARNGATNYWGNRNNLYAKVNGEYLKVTVARKWNWDTYEYDYTYTLSNGTVIASESAGDQTSPTFTGTDDGYLYLLSEDSNSRVYTYTYTDDNGVTQTIGTSTGANTEFGTTLYRRSTSSSGTTRLQALKNAAYAFAESVAKKTAGADGIAGTADDVNHRIAVVGYASGSEDESNDAWLNTELFIGSNQYNYDVNASSYYGQAFQDMSTTAGQNNVDASIGALAGSGATYPNYGLEMANGIFDENPLKDQDRNHVVILFTDGVPGRTGYLETVANRAITEASSLKDAGVTVYAVGIFDGADATSAGNKSGNENQKANWFMQNVSSNNGTVRNPSYYLSAADSDTLTNIFQQISNQIQSGGSSTTLSSSTVIKDIISPAFTLPAGGTADNITLETYHCTGKDGDDYTWLKNADAMGATVTIGSTDSTKAITTDNQVNVTGFDFAENYVGTVTENGSTTYRGDKLVIKITVKPREGFFGGNGVDTNTSAGVYENENADEPVLTFPKPDVNVPLAEPTVNVPDANVYLGAYYSQTVPEDAVKMGATVTIAGYKIDFSKANDPDHPYGLEPWQVEYVNISIAATTEGNNGSFENIQEDITYTVTVTVSPKTPGPSGDQSATATGEGTIHVFKPQLTYQDSQVWYGGDVATDFTGNLTEETWINSDGSKKHNDEDVKMLNTKPELTLSYTPEAGKITTDGKVNTKQDIGVNASVKIGENDVLAHTTFKHTTCGENCSWNIENPNGSPAFLLHVNTCQLTISKSGGASDEPYVFTVYKDGKEYSEITIVGNTSETIYELPVGTYTIKEDTGWSWRYNASDNGSAELTASTPSGSIACSNSKTEDYWLNGFSDVVKNIFSIKK